MGKEAFRKSCTSIPASVDIWGLQLNIFLLVLLILKVLLDSESDASLCRKLISRAGHF